MIGPTGVGKTEIARRVARMIDAPFVKVEATRFTEAGYVGQDVETIVFDLVDAAIDLVQNQKFRLVQDRAESLAKERLIGYLYQQMSGAHPPKRRLAARRRSGRKEAPVSDAAPEESRPASGPPLPVVADRSQVVELLERAQLDDAFVEIELSSPGYGLDGYSDGPPMLSDEYDDEGYPAPAMKRVRRVSVKEARRLLIRDEANKLVDFDEIVDQAVERVEQSGVVFIDELDKIAGPQIERGSDVSGGVRVGADLHGGIGRAGVQRATIVSGDDRNRGDPLGAAGTEDAQRDLTAVRYEQALHARTLIGERVHIGSKSDNGGGRRSVRSDGAKPRGDVAPARFAFWLASPP